MQPLDTGRRHFIVAATATVLLPRTGVAALPKGVKPLPRPRLMQSRNGRFIYDATLDLTGYFLPLRDIKVGTFKFNELAFGLPKHFETFEEQGRALAVSTALTADFEDLSSTEKEGELGPYRANSPAVLSSRYVITRDRIEFVGHDRQVSYVRFIGRADLAFLTSQARMETATTGTDKAVMTGDVFIGNKTFQKIGFQYWAGD